MHQAGKRCRVKRRGNIGSQRSHDVESLRSLPLAGLVDSAHGKLANVEDALGNYPFFQEEEELALYSWRVAQLTDHDPWTPVAIVGVGANGQQRDELRGEKNTSHVEKEGIH